MEQLLDYQKTHVESIINSLVIYNRCVDASDTGTGKTFTSIGACKIIGWKPFIICPKSVITPWINVLKFFKCDFYGITNYELMQNCSYYDSNGNKIKIPFLSREIVDVKRTKKIKKTKKTNRVDSNSDSDTDTNSDSSSSNETKYEYKWNKDLIPQDVLFIFDEAHKCKNIKTNNGQIIHNLATYKDIKILMLSATVVDKQKYFILTGFVLGLYDSISKGRYWIKKLPYKSNPMEGIHKKIYPEYACRMKISHVKNNFPDSMIVAESRQMDNDVEIQAAWDEIKQATDELKKKELNSNALARIIYARQRIELFKIPEFIKLAKEEIEKGNSVVLFVNFTETLLTLAEKLDTKCLIYGEQKLDDRDANIKNFQLDVHRICICNIKAGNCGISLNDINGNFPRVSIISPTWSAQDLIQVLGRIYRAKTKSKVLQRIIFCAKTVEDDVCKLIQDKVANIAFINDGSMDSYKIEGLTDKILIPQDLSNIYGLSNIDNNTSNNNFSNTFEKISKLYERKLSLQKELELINNEIKESEGLLNNMCM